MLIFPNPGYHWDAKCVRHSVCSSRTPQGTAPPTATGWLTVPFVQKWGGSWNMRCSVLKPGKSQARKMSRSSYTTSVIVTQPGLLWELHTLQHWELWRWSTQQWTPGSRTANHEAWRDGLSQSHFFFGKQGKNLSVILWILVLWDEMGHSSQPGAPQNSTFLESKVLADGIS